MADRVAGRVPLILGMSDNCTQRLAEHVAEVDLSGYSAILSVVPYYNKPSQEGIYRHFKAVAEASPLPVVLYNVPGRTGRNMEAATTLRLARELPGRIVGIKEASGSLEQVAEILHGAPEGFQVVSGDDALTRRMIGLGAVGVISVVGNALPRYFPRWSPWPWRMPTARLQSVSTPPCSRSTRRFSPNATLRGSNACLTSWVWPRMWCDCPSCLSGRPYVRPWPKPSARSLRKLRSSRK